MENVFYLGVLIIHYFNLKDKFIIIDNYYEKILEINFDFELKDNKNLSLLDSINEYIRNNEDFIKEKIKNCFE